MHMIVGEQAHAHSHAEETFFLDQLCMIGLSAAYGGVCMALYFWNTEMLNRVLGQQFHVYVMLSGVALLIVAAVRAFSLWEMSRPARAHDHHHDHEHDAGCTSCADDHHHHDHVHEHGHHHEHHEHHHHEHSHAHSHEGHDHDWAPWRYVVLLVPIILFMLGLPSKGPGVATVDLKEVQSSGKDASLSAARLIGTAPNGWATLGVAVAQANEQNLVHAMNLNYKVLESLATDPEKRQKYQGSMVQVIGQFAPSAQSDRFSLARYQIQCCAADAIQINVAIVSSEPITDISRDTWVKVTGRVGFYEEAKGRYRTALFVNGRRAVEVTTPDTNPYIQ